MRIRHCLGALLAAACFTSGPASAAIPISEQAVAVEFYHAGLDHYFISAAANEINDLDTGVHAGWVRTGYRFAVIKAGSTYGGTSPVCRFYNGGVSTHFYSAKPAECNDVKVKFPLQWTFESDEVFRAFLVDPSSGACPADTEPVHRLYNNRADANHRYTTQVGTFLYMKGLGYIPEGDGSPTLPVAFCTPTGGDVVPPASAAAPKCTVTASSNTPTVGSTLTLTSSCSNAPTSYLWSGCTGTQANCSTTRSTTGQATYTLNAANGQGPADAVTVSVNWTASGPPPPTPTAPQCSIETSPRYPAMNTPLLLTATCTQSPASYQWTQCPVGSLSNCGAPPGCSASSNTCTVTSSSSGIGRYIVQATNSIGTGPWVQAEVEWQDNPASRPGFCGQYDRIKYITMPWGSVERFTTVAYGGFSPETVFVVSVTVPAAPAAYATAGITSLAEYNGPPALRQMSLSKSPCDFRTPDPSGANGPFAGDAGVAVILNWNVGAQPVGLQPGQTYYFNFKNNSCGQDFCEASTTTNWPH